MFESKKKSGCFWQGLKILLVLVAIVLVLTWWERRPKVMLNRHLGVEWSDKITRIESEFHGGMDFTAYLYLEGDPVHLRDLIFNAGFEEEYFSMKSDRVSHLAFDDAPGPEQVELTIFRRNEGSVIEYIGLSRDRTQLWYVALDY